MNSTEDGFPDPDGRGGGVGRMGCGCCLAVGSVLGPAQSVLGQAAGYSHSVLGLSWKPIRCYQVQGWDLLGVGSLSGCGIFTEFLDAVVGIIQA